MRRCRSLFPDGRVVDKSPPPVWRNVETHAVKLSIALFVCPQVSWIRQRDLHILTVGILTYTNDQRFQSLHSDGTDEWTLKISSPQIRDSGIYECQVSTEPKISLAYRLNIVGMLISFSFFKNSRYPVYLLL